MRRVQKARARILARLFLLAVIASSGVLFQGQASEGWNGWMWETANWMHNMASKLYDAYGGGGGGGW